MKICVVGAGAVGGLLAAKLSLSGNEVTVVDQGAHLEAIQANGLKLTWEDGQEMIAADIKAVGHVSEAGQHDLVILALKAHYLEMVARDLDGLLHDETMIVTVQNGIPWWYFQNHGGAHDGKRLDTLDPTGILSKSIDPNRIIGCVVYPAAAVTGPGEVRHVEGDRFPIGELTGVESPRALALRDVLDGAGFRSRVLNDIRSEIWLKAWGNLSFNPISALTHETLEGICQFPDTRKLAQFMMEEAQAVAEKLGITFRHTIEARINGAESVGPHKTSMLQDVEAGKSLETEALVGAVLEMGRLTKTECPHTFAVYACVKLLNKIMITRQAGVIVKDEVA